MSEAAVSRLDPLKWGIAILLIAAGVIGNSYYSDQSLLYRVIALLVLAIVAGWSHQPLCGVVRSGSW